jgi:hypothetical protein
MIDEKQNDITARSERQWTIEAWLTLAVALLFLVWPIVSAAIFSSYPTDGWASESLSAVGNSGGPFRLLRKATDEPSNLQAGDIVMAINGRALEVNEAPPLPPEWQVGGIIHYTVRRDAQTIEADVKLINTGLTTFLRQILIDPDTYRSIAWFIIATVVFLLRPQVSAARYLVMTGVFVMGVTINLVVLSDIALYLLPPAIINLTVFYNSGWVWACSISLILFILIYPVRLWPMSRFPRGFAALMYGFTFGAMIYASPRYPAIVQTPGQSVVSGFTSLFTYSLVLLVIVGSLFYNFRKTREPVARAQFRWLAFGLIVGVAPAMIDQILFEILFPGDTALSQVIYQLTIVLSLALPLGLAIGILRYRLFDIDVIIRKTTSYAILTAVLALVYFGSVVVLQRLLSPITGESTAAVVLSTLLIAALFLPLRRRVQAAIDRRFFRKKYDAEQVLARFAATARDETDLDALTAELLRVIQETMEPESVTIWLKDQNL